MPLRAILTSKATARGSDHTALFWQFLCSHCLRGDKRLPSQPQPTTAQTNYRNGRSCIHCGPCNQPHMPSFLSAPHSWKGHYHKALRVRWKRNDVVWCFLCNNGNMPQIPAMLNAVYFSFFNLVSTWERARYHTGLTCKPSVPIYASQNRR